MATTSTMASARATARPRLVSRIRPASPRIASPGAGNTCSIMPPIVPEQVFAVNFLYNIELVFASFNLRC
jgi:hypothetical protein